MNCSGPAGKRRRTKEDLKVFQAGIMDAILFLLARNMHVVEPRPSYYRGAVFFHGFINLKVPRAVTKCFVATWWLCFFSPPSRIAPRELIYPRLFLRPRSHDADAAASTRRGWRTRVSRKRIYDWRIYVPKSQQLSLSDVYLRINPETLIDRRLSLVDLFVGYVVISLSRCCRATSLMRIRIVCQGRALLN